MSNNYELMYIVRPDLSEDQVKAVSDRYTAFLQENGAEDINVKIIGKRRLAYPVKKFLDGIYIQVNYTGTGSHIAAMERSMRISEEVIRYLNLKLKKPSLELNETSETTETEESEQTPVEA